jgi:hypothetical protein
VGFNPRYALWRPENWQGYAPTIGDMFRRGWSLSLHCPVCRQSYRADIDRIIRLKGRAWSPWGKTAPCPRLYCHGRMTLQAYDPRSNHKIDI